MAVEVEDGLLGARPLRHVVGEPAQLGELRAVERVGIGPVELDQVAGGVAEVELYLAGRQLDELRAPRLGALELLDDAVGLVEVVDGQADVVLRRRIALVLEEVELQVADAEPLHRHGEGRRRDPLHAEDLLVEAGRLVEVHGGDAHVVQGRRTHRRDLPP